MPIEYEFAASWLDAIAIGAAILWSVGGMFVLLSAGVVSQRVEGEARSDGPPDQLVRRAKETLARGVINSPLARIELIEVRPDSLVWQGGGGGLRHTASLRAAPSGSGTRVAWQVEAQSGLLTAARWVVAAGAVVTVGLYYLLSQHVLPSEYPAVRGQVFQMCQAVHLLWPPFLLAGLARGMKRRLVRDLDRTLANLRFDDDA